MECYQCYRVIRPATALIKLLALWLQARSQGADEGNKAALPLIWTEHLMYTSLLVIMFTCVPLLNIDLDTIKYDTTRSKQCGMSVPQPANIGYQPIINSLGGKTAAVLVWSGLVWWYFIHVFSKNITSATVATLPCQPDLRQIRFEVQHTHIMEPALAQELRDFVGECYAPSRARLKFRAGELDNDTSDDKAWVGSSYFLITAGYYDTDHALSPHSTWPYCARWSVNAICRYSRTGVFIPVTAAMLMVPSPMPPPGRHLMPEISSVA